MDSWGHHLYMIDVLMILTRIGGKPKRRWTDTIQQDSWENIERKDMLCVCQIALLSNS